jgi:hypothetical protein
VNLNLLNSPLLTTLSVGFDTFVRCQITRRLNLCRGTCAGCLEMAPLSPTTRSEQGAGVKHMRVCDVRSANPVHCWATKPSNLCDYVTHLTHVAGWLRSLPTPQVRTGAPSRASQPHTHQTHHNTTNHLHGSLGSKRNELMTTHTRHT